MIVPWTLWKAERSCALVCSWEREDIVKEQVQITNVMTGEQQLKNRDDVRKNTVYLVLT